MDNVAPAEEMMNIRDLQKEAHAIAKAEGWYDTERNFGDRIERIHSALSRAGDEYWFYLDTADHPVYRMVDTEDGPINIMTNVRGVLSQLAEVVIGVADMAEYYKVELLPWVELARNEDDHVDHIDNRIGEMVTPAVWISNLHEVLGRAWWDVCNRPRETREWVEWLGYFIYQVQRMAAHYGLDLDAAIDAKLEYYRSSPARHARGDT